MSSTRVEDLQPGDVVHHTRAGPMKVYDRRRRPTPDYATDRPDEVEVVILVPVRPNAPPVRNVWTLERGLDSSLPDAVDEGRIRLHRDDGDDPDADAGPPVKATAFQDDGDELVLRRRLQPGPGRTEAPTEGGAGHA